MSITLAQFLKNHNMSIPEEVAQTANILIVTKPSDFKQSVSRPKRPISAYQRWLKDNRLNIGKIVDSNNDFSQSDTPGKQRNHAILRKASKMWNSISAEELAPYTEAFLEDQQRYQLEKKELITSSPVSVEVPIKKPRGRPKGSKNKPKEDKPASDMMQTADIVSEKSEFEAPVKKPRGRPKGSKNKPKEDKPPSDDEQTTDEESEKSEPESPVKKPRGRPKGSKNKPKEDKSPSDDGSSKGKKSIVFKPVSRT